MGEIYSTVYSSVSCLCEADGKKEIKNEMVTEGHSGFKYLHTSNSKSNILDFMPSHGMPTNSKSTKDKPMIEKRRSSFNFSKGNFVYLKRKDIIKEYEFFERIGQGI
ncbi:MAG: hypothetical protein GW795_12865 [Cyanobacteria bacterium]|nr:hypothetical protein [Cyanobacteria bacterium CG_2015-04_32_10]